MYVLIQSLRAFRRAGLFRDDWYHLLLVQLSIHCGPQSLLRMPKSRAKIPKNRPKMGPDGTKMGPKPSQEGSRRRSEEEKNDKRSKMG